MYYIDSWQGREHAQKGEGACIVYKISWDISRISLKINVCSDRARWLGEKQKSRGKGNMTRRENKFVDLIKIYGCSRPGIRNSHKCMLPAGFGGLSSLHAWIKLFPAGRAPFLLLGTSWNMIRIKEYQDICSIKIAVHPLGIILLAILVLYYRQNAVISWGNKANNGIPIQCLAYFSRAIASCVHSRQVSNVCPADVKTGSLSQSIGWWTGQAITTSSGRTKGSMKQPWAHYDSIHRHHNVRIHPSPSLTWISYPLEPWLYLSEQEKLYLGTSYTFLCLDRFF